ncbi:MAG: lamin tail domain-containing protein [Myxococcales bacterium]|nr:lamin tail domain-containing protein [Myxococcales bacterium]
MRTLVPLLGLLAACGSTGSRTFLFDLAGEAGARDGGGGDGMAVSDGAVGDLARADGGGPAADLAVPGDASVPDDLANAPADLSKTVDFIVPTDLVIACSPIRVNEVMTTGNGGATDEFVELYNPCAKAVDLTGYQLVYRSAAGVADTVFIDFNALTIGAQGYLVCGQNGYLGNADVKYGNAMANAGGGIAILAPGGMLLDSVGWGTAVNAFVEKAVAPASAMGKSIGRSPDGVDTNNNANDFKEFANPTPKAKN